MGHNLGILVVDDSPTQAMQLSYLLEEHGFSATTAADGRQGLAAARQLRPALVISDVLMPEMDGYEMCRTLKEDRALSDIPVLLLTTLTKPEDIVKGLKAGADAYLPKPYNEKALLSRVELLLANPIRENGEKTGEVFEFTFAGERHKVTARRQQILNLLLSTYEHTVQQNHELVATQEELRRANSELLQLTLELEDRVAQRTAELQAANEKLRAEVAVRRRAEEALQAQSQELARSNEELEQFAYVASHDLQEPLRMVSSYVQLLARRYEGKLDADADEFIAFAVDGAQRMQKLINGLLAYSRVSSRGKAFGPADCEEILARTLGDLKMVVEEAGAEVTHDPLPELTADATQIGQVFQNLIANAVKFRGEAPPRIHISCSRKGSVWEFSVCDNGIGIEPQYAERIFVIFERLHAREEYPGTGIGLSLCKRIVERHGGRIWVESAPGRGATFYFTIPVRK